MVIKWKNILNRGNKTAGAPAPAACPAGGRLRAAAGLTAFLLGISLLLAGGLGQYGWWSTELGARWARDSLEEDWQDTAALLPAAPLATTTELLNVLTPPPLEMDRVFM